MTLLIDPRGGIRCIYDEAIDLSALGSASITRASFVEPDDDAKWWSDLSPVDGPNLGPFDYRTEAIAAERTWLDRHWLAAEVGAAVA